jgi:FMN phosphatase YigB (HAD superfamily)
MILAIDFDGVLHDPSKVFKHQKMGIPIDGAKEAMQELLDAGHKLIIFTHRASSEAATKAVKEWLKYFDIPYSGEITNVKPNADFFIDDRAIRFNDWTYAILQFKLLSQRGLYEAGVKHGK